MLCYEEGNTTSTETIGILMHHVIAHNLNIMTLCFQEKLAYYVRFRVQCNAVMDLRMLAEELL